MLKVMNIKILIIPSPIKKKHVTLLKSPHVNKRAKENFELRIYKFRFHVCLNFSELKILRCNIPKNIRLKVLYSF